MLERKDFETFGSICTPSKLWDEERFNEYTEKLKTQMETIFTKYYKVENGQEVAKNGYNTIMRIIKQSKFYLIVKFKEYYGIMIYEDYFKKTLKEEIYCFDEYRTYPVQRLQKIIDWVY